MHSATDRYGVDVCLTKEDSKDVPECPHGPMLLFERFFKDGKPSAKYYACSACRDKKDCSFFQWEKEKISKAREQAHKEIIEKTRPLTQQVNYDKELEKLFQASTTNSSLLWTFCHTCNVLVWDDNGGRHNEHSLQSGEGLNELRHPSMILKPLENVKAQAQFLFSNQATQFLVSTIRKLGFKKVLCLGTPRVHEKIQLNKTKKSKHKPAMNSLLLDIDYRYGQFFPSGCFAYYNMFNNHFFEENGQQTLLEFMNSSEGDDMVLVMDPPFGGLVEVLAATVKKIWRFWRDCTAVKDNKKEMPTMWIFPYFMESHIHESLPSLKMMDYKVDYENHPHFKGKQDKGSKRGSPVRIFTNIDPASIKLPVEEGYRLCKICNRYVTTENFHCSKCNSCTSKDGRKYVHCDRCEKCVKPGRVHCSECNRCDLPNHDCQRSSIKGCHICGDMGHKRKNCPTRNQPKKRKSNVHDAKGKKSLKRKSKDSSNKEAKRRK
ncbi:rRNA N6-adenosine-methyltransferase ZCCHC4 [Exaiptasia diaphana]|uniref:Zinc finger CCHC domain-containing protein 4 n=1 Tax=Exaiptasia diaphana TaxID=2652724 RepID=A0A913WSE7_EXADI|nr:rRNA N6-adenosine-methyltransferase ZCCHC4 [Exaiptasia diaphana]KXJ18418.1 Zinc finger CCHC domain-containing protein 4 [Exaiptasia diaphana]